jgi:S1-C subfamily serine protease
MDLSSKPYRKSYRIHPLLLLAVIFIGWWILFGRERSHLDPDAVPRPVTARGDLAGDERNTIDLFQASSPAVVYITTIEVRRSLFSLNIYEIPSGTGSGFIWDNDGHIVTNYHVIQDASKFEVTLADQSTWKGSLVGVAPDKDLAVLHIDAPRDKLKPLPVGESGNLLVGQKVFAIGNPFGLDQTITSGIVSALNREIQAVTGRTIQGVIQTDAAINPGNSGGPLLDSAGRLIGVNTAIYSPSGGSAGIGFAVPADAVNRVVPEIIRYGRVIRPGLGVSLANEQIMKRLDIEGVMIINIQPGGGADKAGLHGTRRVGDDIILGDIIVAVDGNPVKTYEDLFNILDAYNVGNSVLLDVKRNGSLLKITVTLDEVG